MKKHERGDMPKSEWLDKLVFRRMSEIHAVRARMLSHVVYMTEHSQGGGRKIEQPLSLYRFTSFRFPRYFQRAGRILSVYLCDCHRLTLAYRKL